MTTTDLDDHTLNTLSKYELKFIIDTMSGLNLHTTSFIDREVVKGNTNRKMRQRHDKIMTQAAKVCESGEHYKYVDKTHGVRHIKKRLSAKLLAGNTG